MSHCVYTAFANHTQWRGDRSGPADWNTYIWLKRLSHVRADEFTDEAASLFILQTLARRRGYKFTTEHGFMTKPMYYGGLEHTRKDIPARVYFVRRLMLDMSDFGKYVGVDMNYTLSPAVYLSETYAHAYFGFSTRDLGIVRYAIRLER